MIEELKKQVKEIEKQQTELAGKKEELLNEMAKISCPFEIGDIGIINGYTHKGKKGKIIQIHWKYGSWRALATVFKKDGSLGSVTVEIYNEDSFVLAVERVE